MDLTAHREQLLAHYVALASDPGWKAYVWDRVREMARQPHGLYTDFPERLKAAINPPKEKPDDVPAGSSTRGEIRERQRAPRVAR